ncbi:MAG TPA: hypothetical protein VGT41_05085 [Candidatus Babeliales bacterium]|nr:hypothetical protein [Candidatus Babeliales bacterium]
MKNIITYLVLGLTLATNQLYPAAAAGDEEEQKQTQEAIRASLQDPEEIRAQAKRDRELEEFQRKTEQQIKADRDKKLRQQAQEENAAAQPTIGLDQPDEELNAAIAESLQEQSLAAAAQEETKEEEEKEAIHYQPKNKTYRDEGLRAALTLAPGVDELIGTMAQPATIFEKNAQIQPQIITLQYSDRFTDTYQMLTISPNNKLIAIKYGILVLIYDASTGTLLHTLRDPDRAYNVTAITFTLDSRYIITSATTGIARIWDATTGELIHRLDGHRRFLRSVAINAQFIVTGSASNAIQIWDINNPGLLPLHTINAPAPVQSVAINNNNIVLAGCEDGTVLIRNAVTGSLPISPTTGEYLDTLEGPLEGRVIDAVAITDTIAVAGSRDENTYVWDISTGKLLHTLTHTHDPADGDTEVDSVIVSPNGKLLIITSLGDYTTNVWDIANGTLKYTIHKAASLRPAISLNSKFIIIALSDGTAQILDAATGELLRTLTGKKINLVAISPNNQFIVTTSWDGIMRIWRIKPYPSIALPARRDNLIGETQKLITQAQGMRYFPKDLIQNLQDLIESLKTLQQNDPNIKASISTINNTIITTFNAGKAEHIRVPIIKETITQAVYLLNQAKRIKFFLAGYLRAIQEHINALETTPSMTTAHAQDILRLIKKEFELGEREAKEKEARQDQ